MYQNNDILVDYSHRVVLMSNLCLCIMMMSVCVYLWVIRVQCVHIWLNGKYECTIKEIIIIIICAKSL